MRNLSTPPPSHSTDKHTSSSISAPPTPTLSPSRESKEKDSNPKKGNLYKTELCRSWEETGQCRYGNKCQFAHSLNELRLVNRHPKYKSEYCKTFWDKGTCPYGKRCCFIHNEKGTVVLEESSSPPVTSSATPPPPVTKSPRLIETLFSPSNSSMTPSLSTSSLFSSGVFDPLEDISDILQETTLDSLDDVNASLEYDSGVAPATSFLLDSFSPAGIQSVAIPTSSKSVSLSPLMASPGHSNPFLSPSLASSFAEDGTDPFGDPNSPIFSKSWSVPYPQQPFRQMRNRTMTEGANPLFSRSTGFPGLDSVYENLGC